jgi:hypothetical protein
MDEVHLRLGRPVIAIFEHVAHDPDDLGGRALVVQVGIVQVEIAEPAPDDGSGGEILRPDEWRYTAATA